MQKLWGYVKAILLIVPSILSAVFWVFYVRGKENLPDGKRDARIADLDKRITGGSAAVETGLADGIDAIDSGIEHSDSTTKRLSRAQELLTRATERAKETGTGSN